MKKLTLFALTIAIGSAVRSQNVAINADGAAPNASAMLDVDVTALPANNKRGLLVPRVALTATNVAAPVVGPAASLLVYNTATAGAAPNNVIPGYYYWNGAVWVRFATTGDGWLTTGNAGTVAGTNFIGTTDAVDWVIKTGGAAATNERARVLSGGKVVVNNVGVGGFTNDVFSVYADGTTNGTSTNTSALGTRAINGYTSTGFGVAGLTSGTAGTTFGVFGNSTAASGTANGIRGENVNPAASAVVGIGNTGATAIPTATTSRAVIGQMNGTLAGTAVGIGVHGTINATMTTGDARGVQGNSPANDGIGVIGFATSALATANPVGVYGQAASTTGFGLQGWNTTATGTGAVITGNNAATTFLVNGSGIAANGTTVGTFSYGRTAANGIGVVGVGNNFAAIFTPASGAGVAGTGAQYGVVGFAGTTVNTNPLNNSAANGVNGSAGGYFEVQVGGTAQTWSYVAVREAAGALGLRKIIGPGTVNTIVNDLEGNRVALACPEAPENLFQDYGSGQLVSGRARITLDPILSKNIVVDAAHPLRVFVQLEGDCNGVYVTSKNAEGFDVVELMNGSSNTPFTWTVTANRADEVLPDGTVARYSEERFAPAPGPVAKNAEAIRDARSARPSADAAIEGAKP
ncbi:MAG TPA: hypothetical protein PKY96_16290 [Flavobacteriales bacterium]|nr:hypothetical protein [Flavobacteriales bacterium]